MSVMRRMISAAAALIVAAGTLTACAPDLRAGWEPAAWPAGVGRVLQDPPAFGEGADANASSTTDAALSFRLRNDEVGIDARWSVLPGQQAINDHIEQFVRSAVAQRVEATGIAYRPQVFSADAGLSERGCAEGVARASASEILGARSGSVVACEIVMARGPVFAVLLRVVSGDAGTITQDSVTTLYTDTSTGVVGTGSDFIADPGALWPLVVDVIRRDAGSLSLSEITPPDEEQVAVLTAALSSAVLVGGEVIFAIPAALHAAELDGLVTAGSGLGDAPRYIAVPADSALTPLGQAVSSSSGDFAIARSGGLGVERVPCDLVACMSMTLDDGPSSLTPGFLDVLREHESAATFFMLGQNAQSNPDIVRRVAAEGHEIGNHTWNHSYLTKIPDAEVRSQIDRTRALLQQLSGQPVATFRPPGGFVDERVVGLIGEPAIMWSVDTRDWAGPDDASLVRAAVDQPKIGTIILMHDIQEVSSRVFGDVVGGLNDRGFTLVTVEQLFGGDIPRGIVRRGPEG